MQFRVHGEQIKKEEEKEEIIFFEYKEKIMYEKRKIYICVYMI
jgi:hypothetical protein